MIFPFMILPLDPSKYIAFHKRLPGGRSINSKSDVYRLAKFCDLRW